MKNKFLLGLIVAISLILSSMLVVAQGAPAPTQYQGYVKVDGQTPAAGTLVWISDSANVTVGNDSDGTIASGVYSLSLFWDNPDTSPADEGVVAGDHIWFYVADYFAYNKTVATGEDGDVITLNLSISDTSNPTAPSSLTATEISAGVINLSWSAATDDIGVQKYLVYRGNTTGVTTSNGNNIGNSTDTNYTDSGLAVDGSTYFYIVTAMDTSNEGTASGEASETVSDTNPPATPTGLTVADVSGAEGSLFISWSANSESDLSNYTLYFSSDNSSFSAETQTTTTNYTDSSLTDGNTYYYKLMALDTSGNPSANTSVAAGTPTDTEAPSVVTGLTVVDTADTEDSLNISWTASGSADVAGYFLHRNNVLIANITDVSYTDTAVTDGTQYTYTVSAYDEVPNYAANVSQAGTAVDDLAPKVVAIAGSSASNHSVNITWANVTQNSDNSAIQDLTGYLVYMNITGTWTVVQNTSAGTLMYYNDTLNNTQLYQFRITAYDDAGNSGTVVSVELTPSEMPTITLTPGSGSLIKSSVAVNISITSGQSLDTLWYRIYNSTGQQLSDNQTNGSVGVNDWNYSIDASGWLEDNLHTIAVYANDTNGQYIQQNYTYEVDDTIPTVTTPTVDDTNDPDGVSKSTQAITYDLQVTDANQAYGLTVTFGVVGTEVSMTNVTAIVWRASTNASALGCSEGSCTVTYIATDAAGNINNTANYTFTVDDTKPAVSGAIMTGGIINLTNNKVRENDSITVNVTVTDANNISSVEVNNQTMTNSTATVYTYTGNVSALGCSSDGGCTLTFEAIDIAGNLNSSTTLQITVDDLAPLVNVVTIADDYVQNNTAVFITVNVTDNHTSIYNVTAEGTSLVLQGDGLWNGTINLLDLATNAVDVVVTDIVGNERTDSTTTYTVDDVAPSINSITLADDYANNGTVVLLTVNVTDDAINTVIAEGSALTRSGDLWTGNVTLLSADLIINISATDNASNSAVNNSVTYIIDDAAPVINTVTLADDYVRPTQVVLVTVNITDGQTESAIAWAGGASYALTNTSGDIWVGNVTMPSSSGNITVTAADAAENNATPHLSTTFVVDSVRPTFSILTPAAGGVYTNSTGSIVISFNVSDANTSLVNVTLDNGSRHNGSTANGTHTWLFTGLRAGRHSVLFSATDEAGNDAVLVTRSFQIVRPLNLTEIISNMTDAIGDSVLNFTVLSNTTDVSNNETLDANTTLSIEMNLNISGLNVTATIPNFNGLDANWEQTFTIETNESSTSGTRASTRAGTTIETLLLFENLEDFLGEDEFTMATIVFREALGGRDVLYLADDAGSVIYKLISCTSIPTSVATASAACYNVSGGNVTLYLPHFSGGGLANDTAAPLINITGPDNGSTVGNSYFQVNFTVYESNPATAFCNITLTSGATTQGTYGMTAAVMDSTGTAYDANRTFRAVADGAYNLSVYCIDQNNKNSTETYTVTVADNTEPTVTEFTTTNSGSSTVSILLEMRTDEKAVCKYSTSSSNAYAAMSAFSTTNSTYHSKTLSYSSDTDGTYYVLCNDTAGNLMSTKNTTAFDADVSSSPGSSGDPGTTSTVSTYTKAWSEILAGETKTVTIDSAVYTGVPITGLEFMALNDLNSPQLKVRALTSASSSTGTIEYTSYKYLQLVETNFDSDDLTNTKIEFKVPKSWIETADITKGNVALFRFINETWVAQETTITSEDADNVYYEAITSGFSYFAIGQLGEEVIPPPVIPPVIIPPITNGNITPPPTGAVTGGYDGSGGNDSGEGQGDTSKGSGKRAWLWSLVIIIVIIILLFVFWKEGRFQKIIGRAHEKGLHKKEPKAEQPADDKAAFVDDKPPVEDNPKLDEFIRNEIALGHTKSEIKSALEHVGWSKEQIAEGFRDYNKK